MSTRNNINGICLAALTTAWMCATGMADVFHLKNGDNLVGSILSENGDSYLIEVQITRSIKDERRIPKDQIASIERHEKDVEAFKALSPLADIPDFTSVDAYQDRIERLKTFLSEFPTSMLREKAEEIIALHESELSAIKAGGIKIDGMLLTSDERLANLYEIDSRVKAAEIHRHIESRTYLLALREFHVMERDFSGSKAWHDLLPLMRQVCAAHRAHTLRMLEGYDQRIERQKSGLTRLPQEERQRVERNIQLRNDQLAARYDEERALRTYWLSTHEYFKPAMDDTIRMAEQEIRRLENERAKPLPTPSQAEVWRKAIDAIRNGEKQEITAALSEARSARMPTPYLVRLQQLAADSE